MNRSEYAKLSGLSVFATKYPKTTLIIGYIMLAIFPVIWLISEWPNMVKDFKYVKDKDIKALKKYIALKE